MPPAIPQNRLVRKEVALGTLREMQPPQTHIGTRLLAPFQEVATDDVIFDYARGLVQEGMAPARAEDAESELAQKDLAAGGQGRAAVIDWAIKDHYAPSDISRFRESLLISETLGAGSVQVPLTVGNTVEDFRRRVARDDALRRRKLDNRLEWMIMTALETGGIAYNDGKIKFAVDFGRPANQQDEAPAGGTWNLTTSDPIGDIIAVQEYMQDLYGVRMDRAVVSRKVLNNVMNSERFAARWALVGGTPSSPIDPNYLVDGWGVDAAVAVVQRATGLQFIVYDSVYRTRPIGSTTVTNNRFLSEKKVYFLPNQEDLNELDDLIGFGKTLTSPHPEGNWSAGFYEWERDTVDPWGLDRGTGIKMFPIFPRMELTYTMTVLP
jgi:hypothetical protein